MSDLGNAITEEIVKALAHLGASEELVSGVRRGSKDEMYRAAERLDADRHLLACIGSWGDTLNDEDVLASLREWNAGAAAEKLPPG